MNSECCLCLCQSCKHRGSCAIQMIEPCDGEVNKITQCAEWRERK